MDTKQFHSMSSLRIYLKRGENHQGRSWLQRIFKKPLSSHILHAALRAGVTHASVQNGVMGFTKDANAVSYDNAEVVPATLPVCVELVAPRRVLDQFIESESKAFRNATLLMVDGVGLSLDFSSTRGGQASTVGEVEYVAGEAATILNS